MYLKNDRKEAHSYNEILIGSRTELSTGTDFDHHE